jgi:outer membrane protein OmpA-like peptidoglycan-associated protein
MKRFPLLRFDSATGAYKLDADLAFASSEARIAPESEKLLQEFATLFAEPGTRDLRVLVVGRPAGDAGTSPDRAHRRGTEQALAVAEYLRKVGLRGEQIGVSGLGAPGDVAKPAASGAAGKAQRVEIFVMGKKTPIVGWDDASAGRF